MTKSNLLTLTPKGLYCKLGNFYIDPNRVVENAVITHAHSDHARRGMKQYFSHNDSISILKHRLGENINIKGLDYSEVTKFNDVNVSLHPSGHVLGASQVRVEYKGEVWVVTGDYKLENDNFSKPFESIECNVFITETTFGVPIYKWKPQNEIFEDINNWWRKNKKKGKNTVIIAYSLGKAQRLIQNLDHSIGKIYTDKSIDSINNAIRSSGINLKETYILNSPLEFEPGSLIIAAGSIRKNNYLDQFGKYAVAEASGWMTHKMFSRYLDKGIILSDHADFEDLHKAVLLSKADRVYTTHGFSDKFSRSVRERYGIYSEKIEELSSI